MNMLVAASTILTLAGVLFLGSMVRHARRGRLLRAGGSATACAASIGLGISGILIFMSYLGYERLTAEQLVGVIEFSQSAPEQYTARLMIDGQIDRLLTLRGDEWQLDARVVTWKPPATVPLLICRPGAQRTTHRARFGRGKTA